MRALRGKLRKGGGDTLARRRPPVTAPRAAPRAPEEDFGLTRISGALHSAPRKMAQAERRDVAGGGGDDPPPERFVESLSAGDRLLLTIRGELYEGSWDLMVEDLEARLGGRPYIFSLSQKIETDLEAIKRLRGYETRKGVNLADYL